MAVLLVIMLSIISWALIDDYWRYQHEQAENARMEQEAYDQWQHEQWLIDQQWQTLEYERYCYADDTDTPWDVFQADSYIPF